MLTTVFPVPAVPQNLALSRIPFVENQILLAVPLLDEPLPDLITYEEKIPIDMRRGMVLSESSSNCADDVDWHLIETLVNQCITRC